MVSFNTLQDDFSGASLAAQWTTNSAGVTITGGVAQIVADTTFGNHLVSEYAYTMVGSSLIGKTFAVSDITGSTDAEVSLVVEYSGNTNGAAVGFVKDRAGNQLRYGERPGTGTFAWPQTVTYDSAAQLWLRIVESAGAVTLQVSPDVNPLVWTTLPNGVFATPTWMTSTSNQRLYCAGYKNLGAASFVQVDSINIPPGVALPGVPQNVAAARSTTDPTFATLSWTAPVGGATSYDVAVDGGAVVNTPALSFVFGNVSNAAHNFTVAARNSAGAGTAATVAIGVFVPVVIGLPLLGVLSDDFNDASLAAPWTTITPGVTQSGGAVQVTAPTGTPQYLLTEGDFRNQVVFAKILSTFPSTGDVTGLIVRSVATKTQKLRIFVKDSVLYSAFEQGAADPLQSGTPYLPAVHTYWRFRHDATTAKCYLETSPSAAVGSWVALSRSGFTAPGWLADVEFGLETFNAAGTGVSTPPSTLPTVPLAVTRSTTGTDASLVWQPPSSDGGSPITAYRVGRDGSDSTGVGPWTTTVAPTARNQLFSLLLPGTTYHLTVAALNANGDGVVSDATITTAAPAPPTPVIGADFAEDFAALDPSIWWPNLPYTNGVGMVDPGANGSYNAWPNENLGAGAVNPFSIISDASATDGKALRITCRRTTTAERNYIIGRGVPASAADWVGGATVTKQNFTYGYFEFRVRVPVNGVGMFPAWWTYAATDFSSGSPGAGLNAPPYNVREIDMAEIFGVASGNQWAAGVHGTGGGNLVTRNEDTHAWHRYGFEWTPTAITAYHADANDVMQQVGQNTAAAAFYVGGKLDIRLNYSMFPQGSWAPGWDATTPNSMYIDVDYVRHYPTRPTAAPTSLPAAPTAATASVTNNSATLTWAAPSSNGGSAITGYRVARDGTDSTGGGAWTTDVAASPTAYQFSLLNAATTYQLTVAAINANGVGPTTSVTVITSGAATAPPVITAPDTTATAAFATVTRNIDPNAAGIVFSGFGGGAWPGTTNAFATEQAAALKALDVRYVRVGGRWNGSQIITASGGSTAVSNEVPLKWFYDNGFRLMFGFAGETDDFAGYIPANPGNIIRRLKTLGIWGDGSRWDFQGPNEPNNLGYTMQNMIDRCIALYNDVQGEAPGKKIWGPVWNGPNSATGTFFSQMTAARCAGIDWHSYPGASGTTERSIPATWDLVQPGGNDYQEVINVRNMLGTSYPAAGMAVDEINWSYAHGGANTAVFTAANTVMMAMVFAGMIQEGARPLAYADLNGDLSVMVDSYQNPDGRTRSTPMPAYWGIAAMTGGGLPGGSRQFPHYKNLAYATTSSSATTRVYAFNNEDASGLGRNIIAVNRQETTAQKVLINLTGVNPGSFYLFQTRKAFPYDLPVKTGPFAYTTSVAFAMEAESVTVVQLVPAS